MALSTGAHRYAMLDQVILLLVRSKIAIIGGSPAHAAAAEVWAAEQLPGLLEVLPPGWRLGPPDEEAA